MKSYIKKSLIFSFLLVTNAYADEILLDKSNTEYTIEQFNEDQAEAILLMEKLGTGTTCYSSGGKLQGYQSMYAKNFVFDNAKMMKRSVICFNNKFALMGSSNSVYVVMSKTTFVSFNKADNGSSELMETIQLDFDNKIFKYNKSLNAEKGSIYDGLQGTGTFVGNLIKLTK